VVRLRVSAQCCSRLSMMAPLWYLSLTKAAMKTSH